MSPRLKPGNHWRYKYKTNEPPSANVRRWLKQISTNHIKFFTDESVRQPVGHLYTATAIGMPGDLEYVKSMLAGNYHRFKKELDDYTRGQQSLINKKMELKQIQLCFSEALLFNHESQEIDETAEDYVIHKNYSLEKGKIKLNKILNLSDFGVQYNAHLSLRNKYLTLLYEYTQIQLDYLDTNSLATQIASQRNDRKKEMKVLEVWIALTHDKLVPDLSVDEKTALRKKFFAIFNLNDTNFNDRHKNFNDRNDPGMYLHSLAELMRIKYKRIQKKKK